ncbi:uncharacterized protein LOC142532257 [Primulina tabacum]|uniref:uncharacterized protein LOC142532257 n=1 Tax=Primulina tabacum TaxID=48773 RepID=UPI003F59393C
MRQRRWIELPKDYDLSINYHLGKANKVADALSRRNIGKVSLSSLSAQPCLREAIKLKQSQDPSITKIKEQIQEGKSQEYQTEENGVLWMKGRLCVPDIDGIWEEVMSETHKPKFSVHPGSTKMYRDSKKNYWSPMYWDEVREKAITGPELVQETIEKVAIIKERIKAAQDRQKN